MYFHYFSYLAEGCSIQEIAWGYRIGRSTARGIIIQVCEVLWNVLSPSQLPQPNTTLFTKISEGFYKQWNVPNCIGAVDGKHINIKAPARSGSQFFNYKKSFSIVLMATCDADCRFTMIDIGSAGSSHDSTVFKNSCFGHELLQGSLDIPGPKALPNTDIMMPHFLVADAAFPLHQNIIRPFPGTNLGFEKNIFNYRISRARRTIESSFGILSQRWQILRNTIQSSVETCELLVQATIVLHNYLQNSESDLHPSEKKYCPTGYIDYLDDNGELQWGAWRADGAALQSVRRLGANNYTNEARENRNNLVKYFISRQGWVPWQEKYVLRGTLQANM